jgi:hypothetical protein
MKPFAEEIAQKYPVECGYGTSMEDYMVSADVMLSMIVGRLSVTGQELLHE